jgi:protease I
MKLVCAIAPDKFRDEELLIPLHIFADAGIETVIASTRAGTCEGMLGASVEASVPFTAISPEDYDGIVIAGGIGSQDHLWGDNNLIALVRSFSSAGKVVAAICLSPVVLARAGVLSGKKATVFHSPGSTIELKRGGAALVDGDVVTDGMVVTANGPSASETFAKAVIDLLSV